MDLTKVKKQPVLTALLIIITLIPLLIFGVSQRDKPAPNPPPPETTVEAQPVEPKGIAAIKNHTVSAGETLSTIAEAYSIDVDTILGANPDIDETLQPGDKLAILPQKGVLHTVDMGDTLWRISNMYSIDIQAILSANNKNSDGLAIGEKIFVPGGKLIARSDLPSVPVSRSAVSRVMWPTDGEFTSGFGRRWGRLHAGIDIANDVGTPITAALSGRVTYAGWYGGYGYTLMIEHNNGYTTLYGHLASFTVGVGQYVKSGQKIGLMGNTGYSTGPHLHFEVHKDGNPINPMNVLP
ncbi:M23 family metallopeptidase [Dendrosporobacter sp. 1207_IL3150]|uniref:M23 family metallopeptidase n=1 Tax=Dendrosporobacter sp. 1207_IL3150 TaxID=3084054 RepID=UPI002FD8F80B